MRRLSDKEAEATCFAVPTCGHIPLECSKFCFSEHCDFVFGLRLLFCLIDLTHCAEPFALQHRASFTEAHWQHVSKGMAANASMRNLEPEASFRATPASHTKCSRH